MRTFLRVISGKLRGRKVGCVVSEELRPTPQRVREAFFSIMGNAIPGRLFVDVFAGTGVIGIEALSRGASATYFIERDPQFSKDIETHLRQFDLTRSTKLYRTDAYRWIAAWKAPPAPANVFLSPPFVDLSSKTDDLVAALQLLQSKVAEDSLIIVQTETGSPLDNLDYLQSWEKRRYGRNELLIWQREITPSPVMSEANRGDIADVVSP